MSVFWFQMAMCRRALLDDVGPPELRPVRAIEAPGARA